MLRRPPGPAPRPRRRARSPCVRFALRPKVRGGCRGGAGTLPSLDRRLCSLWSLGLYETNQPPYPSQGPADRGRLPSGTPQLTPPPSGSVRAAPRPSGSAVLCRQRALKLNFCVNLKCRAIILAQKLEKLTLVFLSLCKESPALLSACYLPAEGFLQAAVVFQEGNMT